MSLIILERNNFITTVKLNRAEALNALNWDLIDDLTQVLKDLAKEVTERKLRCLMLGTANPKAFCVGADLKERAQMTEEKVVQTLDKLRLLMDVLDDFPAPTIAVLEGVALGGGFELALACDLRIAHVASTMGLPEVGLAIIPGAGGTQRLPRIVGEARAKKLIFLGEILKGEAAQAEGLVHAVAVDPWKKANVWAEDLAQKAPLALRMAKEAILSGKSLPMREALDIERGCYLNLLGSSDRAEGLAAFTEKRPPKYTGQ